MQLRDTPNTSTIMTVVVPTTTETVSVGGTRAVDGNGDGTAGDGIGVGVVLGLCLLIAVLAGGLGWVIGKRRARTRPSPEPLRVPEPSVSARSGREPEIVTAEIVDPARKRLVEGVISARDLIDNPALSERLGSLLDSVGVTTLDPVGARFDPAEHQAQPPPALVSDRALDGTIAEVISYGYRERESITRFPVVTVNRYSDNAE